MRETPSIRLNNVAIERGSKRLISNLTLELSGPELLWVVGSNGIGKTSLLRTCAGLSQAAEGTIQWSLNGNATSAPKTVSFLPTHSYAKAGLRTQEEAAFWNADLSKTNLSHHRKTLTQDLSTGQAKRLSFATLFGDEKPIWVLDEPLAGLDMEGRQLAANLLQIHVNSGGLALVASHTPIPVQNIPTQKLVLQ